MEVLRYGDLVKVEKLVCRACPNFHKVSVNQRTCDGLGAGDEDVSERDFAEEDRSLEEEGDGVDHEGEDDLNK